MLCKPLKNETGVATLIALIMIGMLTLIGLAAMSTSDNDVTIAGNQLKEMRAFYAAEAGLEYASAQIQNVYDSTGKAPTLMPSGSETINGCSIVYETKDNGPAVTKALSIGPYAGLNSTVKSFSVQSEATGPLGEGIVSMTMTFENQLIPIFQYAVFYDGDLEMAPGPDMTLVGRIHTNGNLYIQSSNNLNIDSYVTAAGKFLRGRKGPGTVGAGKVYVKNASGIYKSQQDNKGNWLDATVSTWKSDALSRWGGKVQDGSHGQAKMNLPVADETGNPHKIIERANGTANPDSYENKATLKIVDNIAFKQVAGSWVDVTALMVATGVITYSADKFTDGREGKKVDVTDIDIQKLYANGFAPSNGVIYFSDASASASEYPALRLKNGAELGGGLTIASENPVYTVGNFNTVNKKPASLMGDALTFLSNSWDDSKSALAKTDRIASSSTVNASYFTGGQTTTSTEYGGGFENLPRFLEDWTGKTFTWKGSAVNLWEAQQAVGKWSNAFFSEPIRNWSYDTGLDDAANHPPEAPVVKIFRCTGWQQEHVGSDSHMYL